MTGTPTNRDAPDALTLSIDRAIRAPRAVVWRCWTEVDARR